MPVSLLPLLLANRLAQGTGHQFILLFIQGQTPHESKRSLVGLFSSWTCGGYALANRVGVVRSRLDEQTLRTVATATKGAYHPLGALGEGLARVRSALAMQAAAGDASGSKRGVDRFHWLVAGVLLLVVVESLVGTRKT